jgi:hypothetical protein
MNTSRDAKLESIDTVQRGLAATGYVSTKAIATVLYLACHLAKPILIEGPAVPATVGAPDDEQEADEPDLDEPAQDA